MIAERRANQIARELEAFLESTNDVQATSFNEAVSPAVTFAQKRLRRIAPAAAQDNLTCSVWTSLSRHLAARLLFALTATLRVEQRATRAVTGRTDVTFLETIRAFPGALETAAQLIEDWINAQRELLNRLVRDEQALRSRFVGGENKITAIHPGFSDPHDGGRTVTLIEFSGNRRVLYKPRSCTGEQLWFSALRWLNKNGIAVSFREPDLLPRKNYCWMEFVRRRACRSLEEVRSFYFRWGVQTALAEILAASDLHRENWVAAGSQPVLVDAELIGHKDRPASGPSRTGVKVTAGRQSLPALLDTGLLPLTARDRAGSYRGIAPFDSMLAQIAPINCWPRYRGALQTPSKYVIYLVRGYEAVANIFDDPKPAKRFFQEIMLSAKRGARTCVLYRSTANYARLLRESLSPTNLISAGERKRFLVRECCASTARRPIGLAEARSLSRCDIPKFTARGRTVPVTWKRLPRIIEDLKRSSKILRQRVMLRTRDSGQERIRLGRSYKG